MKYGKQIVDRICSLLSKDSYTIPEVCEIVGIAESTYHAWNNKYVEFSEAIKRATDKFDNDMLVECSKSLAKLIKGYSYTETTTVTRGDSKGNSYVIETKEIEKQVPPNLGAIIHFQTNKDPQNWRNRQSIDATVEVNPFTELMKKVSERKHAESAG